MGLKAFWEDDMLAWISFLVLLVPVFIVFPFVKFRFATEGYLYWTALSFSITAVFWLVLGTLYLYFKRGDSEGGSSEKA